MPYAQPPLGNLRFAKPQAPLPFSGVQQAMSYGAACSQQAGFTPPGLPFTFPTSAPLANISEDCLFVNVLKPAFATAEDELPVLFWLYGGAFSYGDSSLNTGDVLVERSIALEEPMIFVSINYRLNAFGFLASQEVLDAGLTNIGLRDQRFALQWVKQYISAFGGDPEKVTIWGESAGSFSVGLHMVLNDGDPEGLFRAAVMESGSAYALRNVSAAQQYYDFLVEYTDCTEQADTLNCLRQAPYEQIVAAVPIISGDCDDEGTLFSCGNTNITTNPEFLSYIQSNYFPDASAAEVAAVGMAYPPDPILGSPFGTGDANEITSQYKRIAAFTGDWQFEAPRRLTLGVMSQTQDTWAYLYKRGKSDPYLGAYHSSDLPEFFSNIDFIGTDALINFVVNLNPNAPPGLVSGISHLSGVNWPQWGSDVAAPPLLTFQDPAPTFNFTTDNFRWGSTALLTSLSLQMP
ncbi:uncharacterized protein FIBRA_01233 [Fibroporia radiculosa]|uniref:Carboxylic ester hydrolase n=1 Tax=Fibroporia radiculosa TaxID=599839 RepID=J4G0V6_9APHY|nr:uncharacterized protein FIBRA_01233 [Fibroporia radiculosa]CCL99218.1 predicted protein [Fibroporia radiculosa]